MISAETIGFVAGGLSSILFVPQIRKIISERSAHGFSLATGVIGVVSSALWLAFGILQGHLSMIVTNSVALAATSLLLTLKFIYKK